MILHFYTDGACSGNPGPGGASAVAVREDGTAMQMSLGFAITTNNRMELAGVILALVAAYVHYDVKAGDSVVIHTDSQVTYGGLALGWSRSSNADLWAVAEGYIDMLRGNGVEVSYEKASGHSGEKWNDAADRAAVAARKGDRLLEDAGYAAKMRGLLPESARMSPEVWFAALEPVPEAPSKKARKAAAAEAPITEAQVVRFLAEGAKDGTGSAYHLIAAMVARGELSLVHLAAALQARMR